MSDYAYLFVSHKPNHLVYDMYVGKGTDNRVETDGSIQYFHGQPLHKPNEVYPMGYVRKIVPDPEIFPDSLRPYLGDFVEGVVLRALVDAGAPLNQEMSRTDDGQFYTNPDKRNKIHTQTVIRCSARLLTDHFPYWSEPVRTLAVAHLVGKMPRPW